MWGELVFWWDFAVVGSKADAKVGDAAVGVK